MEKYNEVLVKSLIDFDEIKLILANNNSKLIKSVNLRERYFLNGSISFKNANYDTILQNSYVLTSQNNKNYLSYKTRDMNQILISKIEVLGENNCEEFLHHLGYSEVFTIEKNIYTYANKNKEINIINIVDSGLYLGINKDDNNSNLEETLNIFNLPLGKIEENLVIEKNIISKVRRYL